MKSEAGGMVLRGTLDTAACGVMAEQTLLAPCVVCRGSGFASPDWLPKPREALAKARHPWAERRKAVGLQDKDVSLLC